MFTFISLSTVQNMIHCIYFNSKFMCWNILWNCERFEPRIQRLNWRTTSNIATWLTNQVNNQSSTPSTDVIQLTLTLKMTNAPVVEMSVTVNNSPIQDYVHPDDHTQPTYKFFVVNQHCHCNTVRAHLL